MHRSLVFAFCAALLLTVVPAGGQDEPVPLNEMSDAERLEKLETELTRCEKHVRHSLRRRYDKRREELSAREEMADYPARIKAAREALDEQIKTDEEIAAACKAEQAAEPRRQRIEQEVAAADPKVRELQKVAAVRKVREEARRHTDKVERARTEAQRKAYEQARDAYEKALEAKLKADELAGKLRTQSHENEQAIRKLKARIRRLKPAKVSGR